LVRAPPEDRLRLPSALGLGAAPVRRAARDGERRCGRSVWSAGASRSAPRPAALANLGHLPQLQRGLEAARLGAIRAAPGASAAGRLPVAGSPRRWLGGR